MRTPARNKWSYSSDAAVHAPLELPRKPWDQLSDHAPLAAEILL